MATPMFVLALWDQRVDCWMALARSPVRRRIVGLHHQLRELTMLSLLMVEVADDDVDVIEAVLARHSMPAGYIPLGHAEGDLSY